MIVKNNSLAKKDMLQPDLQFDSTAARLVLKILISGAQFKALSDATLFDGKRTLKFVVIQECSTSLTDLHCKNRIADYHTIE